MNQPGVNKNFEMLRYRGLREVKAGHDVFAAGSIKTGKLPDNA